MIKFIKQLQYTMEIPKRYTRQKSSLLWRLQVILDKNNIVVLSLKMAVHLERTPLRSLKNPIYPKDWPFALSASHDGTC